MGKLVMIDSQIFIWGIKEQSIPDQSDKILQAKTFIDWLSENGDRMLIPTPLIAEILSPVPANQQHKILSLIDRRFHVAPFDALAAMKCAELLHLSLNDDEIKQYRAEHRVAKNKLKFDCMLVAIAITRNVDIIYTEDDDLLKFAHGQIEVKPMHLIPTQFKLDFNDDSNAEKDTNEEESPF